MAFEVVVRSHVGLGESEGSDFVLVLAVVVTDVAEVHELAAQFDRVREALADAAGELVFLADFADLELPGQQFL